MFTVNLKHVFFLIIGLNILVVFVFLNISKSSSTQTLNGLNSATIEQLTTQTLISNNQQHHQKSKTSKSTAGEYLKSFGKPSYVDDLKDPSKNYGNMDKAIEKIRNYYLLREYQLPEKETFTRAEVLSFLYKTVEGHKKAIDQFTKQYEREIKSQLNENANLSPVYKRISNQFSISNPLRSYGLYTYMRDDLFNAHPKSKAVYSKAFYGIKKDSSYCDIVDIYNLYHPENIYKNMNFVVDYAHGALVRDQVAKVLGWDAMPDVYMGMKNSTDPLYPLNINATIFFTKRIDFHHYHEISVNFLCLTQSYGHLPGNGVLTRKDLNVEKVNEYAKRYANNTKCFNKNMFFPAAYRFNIVEECREFFNIINSQEFELNKKTDPIQFIVKQGHSAHRASGLYLFDEDEERMVRMKYKDGLDCGKYPESFLAQKYVSNPLLLDKENKFDFRIYMLIASVNPLIVYYHDGFLRLSLTKYDKFSKEKNVHFTNTHLSKEIFAIAQKQKEYMGMTEDELREYQMWSMEDLNEYLYEIGKISDKNWLQNYLRPKFQEAFIHINRMVENDVLKHSGVFEMFGLDFMLDDNLNLWFIECNSSPQLIGTSPEKTKFLITLLSDMFDIQNALLRSRFKRIQGFMAKLHNQMVENKKIDIYKTRKEFAIINRNKFEPEFNIRQNNTFVLIMDKSIKGPDAYFGHLKEECIDDLVQ